MALRIRQPSTPFCPLYQQREVALIYYHVSRTAAPPLPSVLASQALEDWQQVTYVHSQMLCIN